MTALRVLDLFSGIGGFSLGLERTGGFETAAFCEIEPFPRKVLAKHWPGVPCYEDVRELTADVLSRDGIGTIDVITGGFPCQDISVAGKQRGMGEGTRSGLWSEIIRLVGELRPRYVIVENVAALLSGPSEKRGGWFGRILGDLAECGYDAEWECMPAGAVGAPHERDRVWILAYPSQVRDIAPKVWDMDWQILYQTKRAKISNAARGRFGWAPEPGVPRVVNGLPNIVDRRSSLGNAVVPQIPEMIGNAILRNEAAA
jgi:DNA (cytosine-5)-methyltransferase 1